MAESMSVDDVAMDLFDSDMDDFRDNVLDDRLLEDDTDYASDAQGVTTPAGMGTGFMSERTKPLVNSLVYKSKTGAYVGPEACSESIEEYLYCQVCKIDLGNMKTAVLHYKGKSHQKMLNQMAEKIGALNVPLLTGDLKQAGGQTGDQWTDVGMQGSQALNSAIDATLMERAKNVFVDDKGQLWGPERYATTLGQFKNCPLCDVKASSFKTATEHYAGVKHIRKLKNLASHKGLEFKKLGNCEYQATARGPVERDDDPLGVKGDAEVYAATKRKGGATAGGASKKSKIDGKTFCDICNLELTSEVAAQMHYEGKKHRRKLEYARLGQEGARASKMTLDLVGSGIFFCPKCDVMCMSQEQLNEHCQGRQHKAILQAETEEFEKSKKEAEQAAGTGSAEPKAYGCRICDIQSNSKNQYLEHLESKKHLKKFAQYSEKKLGKRLERVQKRPFDQRGPPLLPPGRHGQWPNWEKPWEIPPEQDWLGNWDQSTDQGYGYEEGWENKEGGGYEEGWGNEKRWEENEGWGQRQGRRNERKQEWEDQYAEDNWNAPRRSDQLGRGKGPMSRAPGMRGNRGRQEPQRPRGGAALRGRSSNRGGVANSGGGGGGGFGSDPTLELLNNLPPDAVMRVTEALSNLTKQLLDGMTPGGMTPGGAPSGINWMNDQNYQSYRDQGREPTGSSWGNSDARRPPRGGRGRGMGRGFALR